MVLIVSWVNLNFIGQQGLIPSGKRFHPIIQMIMQRPLDLFDTPLRVHQREILFQDKVLIMVEGRPLTNG